MLFSGITVNCSSKSCMFFTKFYKVPLRILLVGWTFYSEFHLALSFKATCSYMFTLIFTLKKRIVSKFSVLSCHHCFMA